MGVIIVDTLNDCHQELNELMYEKVLVTVPCTQSALIKRWLILSLCACIMTSKGYWVGHKGRGVMS